jgi:PAT family acetyl-CoA transporter-like MFS transporter 1
VLKLIDMLTVATCHPPTTPPIDFKGDLITSSFSCVAEVDKTRCLAGGGDCNIDRDGYYVVNILCVIIGLVTFWGYIKITVKKLQALPMRAWRLGNVG